MKDINFLPHWYIEKKTKICRRIAVAAIISLVLINTLLAYNCISGSYKIYILEKKEAEKDLKPAEANIEKEIDSIRLMDVFIGDFIGKFNYQNVSIEGSSLSFEIPYSNKNDYYNILKQIEDSGNYRMISISQSGDISGKSKLRVILEVKP
ncbi:MAG: hypothetical protein AB9844_10780 [Clostridiaceae bacterium]